MRKKTLVCICTITFCIFMVLIIYSAWYNKKYGDRIKYIENTFGIEIADMVEGVEGRIKPGSNRHAEHMQLKLKVKQESKRSFLNLLYRRSHEMKDLETTIDLLDYELENNSSQYLKEIKNAGIQKCLVTNVVIKDWDISIRIFVTEQNGEMIVYFIDM